MTSKYIPNCPYPQNACDCDFKCQPGDEIPTTSPYPNLPSKWKALRNLLNQPTFNFRKGEFPELLTDLQANIVIPHRKKYSCNILLDFDFQNNAIDWITGLKISNAFDQLQDADNHSTLITTLCLSYKGYEFFHVPDTQVPGVKGDAFRRGYTDINTFPVVEDEILLDRPHAMLQLASDTLKEINTFVKKLEKDHPQWIVSKEYGQVKVDKKMGKVVEWFGFRDGISNPRFFPDYDLERYQQYAPAKESAGVQLKLILDSDPGGQHWYSCGTFVAFLKLRQHPEVFENRVKKVAKRLGTDDLELAAAYLIGRFRDGTPLTLSNKATQNASNDFDYSELVRNGAFVQTDKEGGRCPFHAHIRKANPRTPGMEDRIIARRGITYDHSKESNKEDKGLLFLSCQRSLEDQFEYILRNWMHSEYLEERRTGPEPITSSNFYSQHRYPGKWNTFESNNRKEDLQDEAMVTFLGGDYFFAPAISTLKSLMYLKNGLNPNAHVRSSPIPKKYKKMKTRPIKIHRKKE